VLYVSFITEMITTFTIQDHSTQQTACIAPKNRKITVRRSGLKNVSITVDRQQVLVGVIFRTRGRINQVHCIYAISICNGHERHVSIHGWQNSAHIILFSVHCGRITGTYKENDILQYFLSVVDVHSTSFCLCEAAVRHSLTTEVLNGCYHDHMCQLFWEEMGSVSLNSSINWE